MTLLLIILLLIVLVAQLSGVRRDIADLNSNLPNNTVDIRRIEAHCNDLVRELDIIAFRLPHQSKKQINLTADELDAIARGDPKMFDPEYYHTNYPEHYGH